MNFRLRPHHFTALLLLAAFGMSVIGRNTTAADHHWQPPAHPPLRVALTFDDGPNGQATRQIVDILHRLSVPATFFEVGRSIAQDPATTQYVAQHGFTIGNHSWDHAWDIPKMPEPDVTAELERTSQIIHATTGTYPSLMHWPHGAHTKLDDAVARSLRLRTVNWNVDPRDYNTQSVQLLAARVMNMTQDLDILLLHDGLQDGEYVKAFHSRRGTVAALPMILEGLFRRGAEFYTVPDILDLKYQREHATR